MFTSVILTSLLFFSPPKAAKPQFAPSVPSTAADAATAEKTATRVAQAFESHYRRTQTITGVFLEKYTSGGSGIVAESGTVYFEKPGRMRWDYDSPQPKMFLVDGKNVWFYVPADHTASRTSIKESADWRTPLALLAGKVKLERLCGSLTLGGSDEQGNEEGKASEAGDSVLVCGPRKGDESIFSKALLEINSRDQLVRLDIKQPGDIETEYRFGDWHENVAIAQSKFHFEPPPGVAIVNDASLAMKVQ